MRYNGVLAFDDGLENVLLVLKQHGPKHLRGTWNGIGGKMEEAESPVGGAVREFAEETGIHLTKDDLVAVEHQRFLTGHDAGNEVYWYATRVNSVGLALARNDVGERIDCWPVEYILSKRADLTLAPNMVYLIPKARRFLQLNYLDRPH